MDRSKNSNKNNKKFEELKNLPCPFHKNAKHMAAECRQLQELGFYDKSNKGKGKADKNKDGDNNDDPSFQQSKGQIIVIFVELSTSSNKRSGKLGLWNIMVGEPLTPKYLIGPSTQSSFPEKINGLE